MSYLRRFIFLLFLILLSNSPLFGQTDRGGSEEIEPGKFEEQLKIISKLNQIDKRICFGYRHFPGGLSLLFSDCDEILIYGDGSVQYKTALPFCDRMSGKFLICEVEYKYTIESQLVREICEEFLNSKFITETFEEERKLINDDAAQRGIFIKIDDLEFEKIFFSPMSQKDREFYEERYQRLVEKGIKVDGVGIPKKLERLQFLFDEVIKYREITGRDSKGTITIIDDKGLRQLDLRDRDRKSNK